MEKKHLAVSPEAGGRGHASTDVRIRGFVFFVAGFVTVAVILQLTLYWLYGVLSAAAPHPPVSPLAIRSPIPPQPQLQGSAMHLDLPPTDLAELTRTQEQRIEGYGWVDRGHGIARIPIERAMSIVLEHGLPTQPTSSGQGEK